MEFLTPRVFHAVFSEAFSPLCMRPLVPSSEPLAGGHLRSWEPLKIYHGGVIVDFLGCNMMNLTGNGALWDYAI